MQIYDTDNCKLFFSFGGEIHPVLFFLWSQDLKFREKMWINKNPHHWLFIDIASSNWRRLPHSSVRWPDLQTFFQNTIYLWYDIREEILLDDTQNYKREPLPSWLRAFILGMQNTTWFNPPHDRCDIPASIFIMPSLGFNMITTKRESWGTHKCTPIYMRWLFLKYILFTCIIDRPGRILTEFKRGEVPYSRIPISGLFNPVPLLRFLAPLFHPSSSDVAAKWKRYRSQYRSR